MCCQVEISVTGRSLAQRSPTDCGVSLCVIQKPKEWGGPGLRWAVAPEKEKSLRNVKERISRASRVAAPRLPTANPFRVRKLCDFRIQIRWRKGEHDIEIKTWVPKTGLTCLTYFIYVINCALFILSKTVVCCILACSHAGWALWLWRHYHTECWLARICVNCNCLFVNRKETRETWKCHSSEDEVSSLLDCHDISVGKRLRTFRKIIVSSSRPSQLWIWMHCDIYVCR